MDKNKILKVLEDFEKEYINREKEFPCKYYAGRADAFHEIWEIVANMESESNPYKRYEKIKEAVSTAGVSAAQYEQLLREIADILGI